MLSHTNLSYVLIKYKAIFNEMGVNTECIAAECNTKVKLLN